jgi:hypothetical protein
MGGRGGWDGECGKGHRQDQHTAACIPAADPRDKDLRLIRAVFGLCPDCDRTDVHSHMLESARTRNRIRKARKRWGR